MFSLCLFVYQIDAYWLWRLEEGVRSLELGVQIDMSHYVVLEIETQILGKSSKCF